MEQFKLLIILKAFFLLLSVTNAETMEARNALVEFMTKLSPPGDKETNWGWNTTSDPCNDRWKGVKCYTDSPNIKKIVLEELQLSGILDASSLCMTKALMVLSLNSNNVSGTFPGQISKCRSLTHIYLNGNKFSGNLPASLSQLGQLKRLIVSDNEFSGEIPDVSRISGLLTFRAENNHLSGGIPKFHFSSIQEFNVSNNDLSGPIPDLDGKFNETSFLGNPGLCGEPLPESCPPSPPAGKNGSSNKDRLIYAGYAAIGVVIIAGLVAFKLIKKRRTSENRALQEKGLGKDNTNDTSSDYRDGGVNNRSEFSITSAESGKGSTSLVVLSKPIENELRFEDLLRSPAELIGRGRRGSLYKVILNDRLILAVKRIREWDISMEDFKKRMQRMDSVKHPNVMQVVAFYCSRQEKLLVYEFQEKGSLFMLLHGSPNNRSFNWESRLTIAAKISEALACMHERLQADGIAHGNLKSSNILFDSSMEPCISEYGLAATNHHDQSAFLSQSHSFQENINSARNSFFKADIYSFGVILLELLTGRPVQNNSYDLAACVDSTIREEWTAEIFDKRLVSEGANEEQMFGLLQVALKCIDCSPGAITVSMREVSGMIKTTKDYDEKSMASDP